MQRTLSGYPIISGGLCHLTWTVYQCASRRRCYMYSNVRAQVSLGETGLSALGRALRQAANLRKLTLNDNRDYLSRATFCTFIDGVRLSGVRWQIRVLRPITMASDCITVDLSRAKR